MTDQAVRPRVTQLDILEGAVKPRHLEKGTAPLKFGLSADRPTSGAVYPFYAALDTGKLSFWNGTTWIAVN